MEKWNTRTLGKKIGSMLFERTALSKNPDNLIQQEQQMNHARLGGAPRRMKIANPPVFVAPLQG